MKQVSLTNQRRSLLNQGGAWLISLLIAGCSTQPPIENSDIAFSITPSSGVVEIKKTGYSEDKPELGLNAIESQIGTAPLAKNFAEVKLSTLPLDAIISINSTSFSGSSFSDQLDAGTYELTINHPKYFPQKEILTIQAGKPLTKVFSLSKIPTHSNVVFSTLPEGGVINFQGNDISSKSIQTVPFGRYVAKAVKEIDNETHLEGSKTFDLNKPEEIAVIIKLNQRTKLFEGRWLLESTASKLEQESYLRQRVGNPVHITIVLSDNSIPSLPTKQELIESLMVILRVGDRITFKIKENNWVIWKRHQKPTPDFIKSINAFSMQTLHETSWQADTVRRKNTIKLKQINLAEIAYEVHRNRALQPLLDLYSGQIQGQSETIIRNSLDGAITVLAYGDIDIVGNEIERKIYHFNSGVLVIIAKGGGEFTIRWKNKPKKLLVMSDLPGELSSKVNIIHLLKKNEKKLLKLSEVAKVIALKRLTKGPDYKKWDSETMETEGPLADQIDFNTDEIGPNKSPGTYQRIWIAKYMTQGRKSQRQLSINYNVDDNYMEFGSDNYFRNIKNRE